MFLVTFILRVCQTLEEGKEATMQSVAKHKQKSESILLLLSVASLFGFQT